MPTKTTINIAAWAASSTRLGMGSNSLRYDRRHPTDSSPRYRPVRRRLEAASRARRDNVHGSQGLREPMRRSMKNAAHRRRCAGDREMNSGAATTGRKAEQAETGKQHGVGFRLGDYLNRGVAAISRKEGVRITV